MDCPSVAGRYERALRGRAVGCGYGVEGNLAGDRAAVGGGRVRSGGHAMRDSGRRRTLQRAGSAPVALGTCLAGLMVLQSAGGCVPSRMELDAFLKSDEYLASGSGYRVLPGDAVSIASPQVLELDGTKEPVGINGKIDLDLIGQIHVAGLTPKEIRNKLELQLTPYYAEPQLRVRVAEGMSKKIYVFGQVAGPGARPYTGRDTVLDVVAEAGPTHIAWKSQIKVFRASATPGERHEIKVDFERMMEQGDLSLNVLLQEGDIVWVPPTILGWIGLRVQELLYPVQPVMEAYEAPSEFMDAYDRYNDRNQYDDDDNDGRRSVYWRRR